MKRTVQQPPTARSVKAPQFEDWAKKEILPQLRDLYDFANFRYTAISGLSTAATGTYTTIWTDEMPDNSAWNVEVQVLGRCTSGTPNRATYRLMGLFSRDFGAPAAQQGATASIVAIESVAGFDARFLASGNNVSVQVTDDGALTMKWQALVWVQEVTR